MSIVNKFPVGSIIEDKDNQLYKVLKHLETPGYEGLVDLVLSTINSKGLGIIIIKDYEILQLELKVVPKSSILYSLFD